MKKRIRKTRRVKSTPKTVKNKKIEVEEYTDSVTDTDDNTKPEYPFDEGKSIVVKEDDSTRNPL